MEDNSPSGTPQAYIAFLWNLRDGDMVLEGETKRPDGTAIMNRITWSIVDRDPDTVRQHWQSSTDGGATWTTAFDGTYRRR